MGNIHSGVNNYVERLSLGDSSEVVLRKTESRQGRDVVDTWSAEYYSLGRRSCELSFTKTNRTQHEDEVTISIHDRSPTYVKDDIEFRLDVKIVDGLLLGNFTFNGPTSTQQLPVCKTPTSQGGVLKSSSFLYNDTDRKGLIAVLRARSNDDDEELPYMITVKHYFLAANSSHGAYVVAKICSDDSSGGGLSFQVEKPVAQPRGCLLTVFNDVKGKGWKLDPNSSDFAIELPNQNTSLVPGRHNNSSIVNSGITNGNFNGSKFYGCPIMFGASRPSWY